MNVCPCCEQEIDPNNKFCCAYCYSKYTGQDILGINLYKKKNKKNVNTD